MNRRAERFNVLGYGRSEFVDWNIVTVHEIYMRMLQRWIEPGMPETQLIPAHVRNLEVFGRGELHDGIIKYAEALRVVLLRKTAQQLHSKAYTQNRLFQRPDHLVQLALAQVVHR